MLGGRSYASGPKAAHNKWKQQGQRRLAMQVFKVRRRYRCKQEKMSIQGGRGTIVL